MDFSQLFNFLPLSQAGGSGEASGGYQPSEEDQPDPESHFMSMCSAPTLPRFHQAFQLTTPPLIHHSDHAPSDPSL
uniref:Uncharacterized protein n=1 Tax=Knipowitschia caucasica TaxID=637954 RepID=A0AAV2JKJ9_KNICA